jgi:hypothetical protein
MDNGSLRRAGGSKILNLYGRAKQLFLNGKKIMMNGRDDFFNGR